MKAIAALIDFSSVSEKVVAAAGEQAKAFGARVILMHIVPKEEVVMGFGLVCPVVLPPTVVPGVNAHRDAMEAMRDSLAQTGVDVLVEHVTDCTVEKLMEECRTWKIDLIVLGSHQHSTIYNWFVGAFTAEVLESASCPVLVVPAEVDPLE